MNGSKYVSLILSVTFICLIGIPAHSQLKPKVPLPIQQPISNFANLFSPSEEAIAEETRLLYDFSFMWIALISVPADWHATEIFEAYSTIDTIQNQYKPPLATVSKTSKARIPIYIVAAILGFAGVTFTIAFLLIRRRRINKPVHNTSSHYPKSGITTGVGLQPHRIGKKAYIGQWEGEGISLEITWQGNVSREYIGNKKIEKLHGFIQFSGKNFSICDTTKHNCTVQVPPHKRGNRWQMVADGITMYKIDDCFRWLKAIGRENYEGFWEGENISIEIHATGNSTASSFSGKDIISGKIKFIKHGFAIGNTSFMRKFEVQQEPAQENGQWFMIVNGLKMKRIKNHAFAEPVTLNTVSAASSLMLNNTMSETTISRGNIMMKPTPVVQKPAGKTIIMMEMALRITGRYKVVNSYTFY